MPNTFQKAASETMGAVKDVKATFKGLTGVFKHLMEEHGKAGALLKLLKNTSDESTRADLWAALRADLLSHEMGESAAVYPVLAQYTETASIAEKHTREAYELQAAIRNVDQQPYSSKAWINSLNYLAELVEQHVAEEEGEFFPKAQKVIGKERASELLPLFEAAKSSGPGKA